MQCPACEGKLYRLTLHDLEVNVCAFCNGIWFDDGELTTAANKLIGEGAVTTSEDHVLFKKRNIERPDPNEGHRLCPKCVVTLKKTNFAYDSNVFVDKCQNCNGIWTDKGELKQIAGFLKGNPETREIGKALIKSQQERVVLDELSEAGGGFSVRNSMTSRLLARRIYRPIIMLPLSTDTLIDRMPFLTYIIITSCSIVFAIQMFAINDPELFFQTYGYIRLKPFDINAFTSIFLHGNLLHLFANMFLMWIFSRSIECKLGPYKFAALFFGTSYIGCITQTIIGPERSLPIIGASASVAGIMGAFLASFPKSRLKVFWLGTTVHIPAYIYLIGWFLVQLFNSLLYLDLDITNIAWFSHIAGFGAGYFTARMFDNKRLKTHMEEL